MTTTSMRLVDPTGADPGRSAWSLSPRPADLRGKRIGLLDNSKANSDVILRGIAALLNDEYEFAEVIYLRKHSASPASQAGSDGPNSWRRPGHYRHW